MKDCMRCGQMSEVSNIGTALINFVCDTCRRDFTPWEFNGVRIEDLERQMLSGSSGYDDLFPEEA